MRAGAFAGQRERGAVTAGLFLDHHGVGAGGQRSASEDANRFARLNGWVVN